MTWINITNTTKKIIITLLSLALITGLTACSNGKKDGASAAGEKRTVRLAYLPITHAVPLYIENELKKEKFKGIEIELVKFGSWPELMDALSSGNVDGASVLIELAMKAKEQGTGLKAVALGHRNGNAVIVSPDIDETRDLKGKSFAIPHRLSSHNILLYLMLKNAGMSLSDINIIELPPPEMPAALAEGRISGYIVAEPFGAKAVAMGKGKVLYQSEDLWENSVCCGLVLNKSFISKDGARAKELIDGYREAGEYIETNNAAALEIAGRYMKLEPDVLKLSMKWISYGDLRIYEKDYNDLSGFLKEMGLFGKTPSYGDFVDASFIGGRNEVE